jgi:hypothetical protein
LWLGYVTKRKKKFLQKLDNKICGKELGKYIRYIVK